MVLKNDYEYFVKYLKARIDFVFLGQIFLKWLEISYNARKWIPIANFTHPIVFWIQICLIRQGYLLNSTENLANSSGCDKFDRSVEFVVFPNWNTVSRNNNKMKKTGLEKKILMITLAHLQSIPKRFGNRPFSWLWDSNLLIYLKI